MNNNGNAKNNNNGDLQKPNIRKAKLKFNIDKKRLEKLISKIDKRIEELASNQKNS